MHSRILEILCKKKFPVKYPAEFLETEPDIKEGS